MTRKTLTPSAAMEIKRLYSLTDENGKQLHTMMDIAEIMGVGETTVYRAIKSRGAYMAIPALKTDDDAAASEKRFREMNPQLFPEGNMVDKMQQQVTERKETPAKMLDEIEDTPFTDRKLAKELGYL